MKTIESLVSALSSAFSEASPMLDEIAALIDKQGHSGLTLTCQNSEHFWTEYASTAARAVELADQAGEGYSCYTTVFFSL